MTAPHGPLERTRPNIFITLLTARKYRWVYLLFLGTLVAVALASSWLVFNDVREIVATGLSIRVVAGGVVGYGALALVTTLGGILLVVWSREYRQREIEARQADSILGALSESDFELFDRQRLLRREKDRIDFERNLRASIRLDRVEATSVRLFPTLQWQLQPGVNVLLGRNGYGKTLLLRALVGALQRDEDATQAIFDSDVRGAAEATLQLRVRRDGAAEEIQRDASRFHKAIGKVPVLAIPDSRFFDRSQDVIGPVSQETADLKEYGAYHFLHQRSYGSVIQGFLYDLGLQYWEGRKRFSIGPFKFLEECVRRLTEAEFRFVSVDRRGRAGFAIGVLTEGNTQPLPIQTVSQGTLSLLAMLGLVRSYVESLGGERDTGRYDAPAIVVIDEADAHLHPIWQQRVPALLKEFFPNTQFILSAHSPLFVAGCWRGEVAVLRRAFTDGKARGFHIQQLDRDFVGATSEELYRTIFEIDEPDPSYLEYATKATVRTATSARIDALETRAEKTALTDSQEVELRHLHEESRRIHRVLEVTKQRRAEIGLDAQVAALEAENMRLRQQVAKLRGAV